MKFANRIYTGPMILLGVRQGCPLSMVLFALCLEPLLRLLEKYIGHPLSQENPNALGAFADDIGAVLLNISETLPSLVALFDVFAGVSNLHLNVGKCCCIPLCDASASDNFVSKFLELAPAWSEIAIQDHAEYPVFVCLDLGVASTYGPMSLPRRLVLPVDGKRL